MMTPMNLTRLGLPVVVAFFLSAPVAPAVTIDWVTVGDPGNACDTQPQGCFGAVGYEYQISKYEVTHGQYADFLNAVAAADPHDLYNTAMGTVGGGSFYGITRSGSSGSYTYSANAWMVLWADLLKRVFGVEALRCECGHSMRVIAAITEPTIASRILKCMGLPPRAPPLESAHTSGFAVDPWLEEPADYDQSAPNNWEPGG